MDDASNVVLSYMRRREYKSLSSHRSVAQSRLIDLQLLLRISRGKLIKLITDNGSCTKNKFAVEEPSAKSNIYTKPCLCQYLQSYDYCLS